MKPATPIFFIEVETCNNGVYVPQKFEMPVTLTGQVKKKATARTGVYEVFLAEIKVPGTGLLTSWVPATALFTRTLNGEKAQISLLSAHP